MLVSMKNLLSDAEKENYAVGGFNCPGLEYVLAVIRAAESLQAPVVLSFPQVHEKTVPLDTIAPILLKAADKSTVPVCVHLDHGSSIDYIHRALNLGFLSVMYDGSALPFDENIRNTSAVVDLAAKYGADVEAELGGIAGDEAGISSGNDVSAALTDPAEAVRFAHETGIASLAASIGTAHGFYTAPPSLNFDRIRIIHQKTGLPLVMHGGSGVSTADYKTAIKLGIRKINYYSYMAKAGVDGVRDLLKGKDVRYFHEISCVAKGRMEEDVRRAIHIFTGTTDTIEP